MRGVQTDEPVTILTVAREAGVSKTTASDALRGSGRVSEATRAAVAQVAERLGYVPNGSARHLRRASTGTIGLHVPEVLTRSSYYMSFVFGAVERAARHDYDVTLITSGQRRPRPPRVDGLVLGDPLGGDPVVESLMGTGLPTVSCERFPGDRQADGVVWSEHAEMLTRLLGHLRSSGAARPALIVAGDESDWAASLHRGYLGWCAGQGVAPLVRRVSFDATGDEVRAAARDLLRSSPLDALVCAPAGAATEVAPLLRESGGDVLLASCVDSAATRLADPPITAIDLRPREAGESCAELLFELLAGAAPAGTERLHPIELAVRASTRRVGI
ncbi:LacI family transcriptional regulator [Nonomuraea longispora]|uniref:LacI family transcriptional regulator n=1 Tax=Nonomuraea longispora TaxID=1848320 RepID=A0A4R4N9Y3_9ACTN|nr:LacI family transcriptional regulator [Nonomuraea longispora]